MMNRIDLSNPGKEDLPLVSGKLESFIIDLKESWGKYGWIFVVLNIGLAAIVLLATLKKRLK